MDNSTNSEKLVPYLDGELTGNEKEELENRLSTDKILQEELESLRLTRDAIRSYGLKQRVAGIHTQMMNEMQAPVRKISSTRRILRYSMAVAASLLLIFLGIRTYNNYNLSNTQLFADNYRVYELSETRDGGTRESGIEKAYKAKEYNRVIALADTSKDTKGLFLSALASLELKNSSDAIRRFNRVLTLGKTTGTTAFRDESEYYLALAFILNKDYDFAWQLLQKIKDNPRHLYHEKATGKLIRKIKRLK